MTARPPNPLRALPDASRVQEPTGCTGIPEGASPPGRAAGPKHKRTRASPSLPVARFGETWKPSIAETAALSFLVAPEHIGRVIHDKSRAGRSVRLTAAQVVRLLALVESAI